jgi:hypothetical protein
MAVIIDVGPVERRDDNDADVNDPDADDANANDPGADDADANDPGADDADANDPGADDADANDEPSPTTAATTNAANNGPKTTAVTTAKTTNQNAAQGQLPKTTAVVDAMSNKPTMIPTAVGNAADPTVTAPAWLSDLTATQARSYTWGQDRASDLLHAQSAYSTILAANPALATVNMTGLPFDMAAYSMNSSQRGCYSTAALPMALAMNDTCNLGFFCT